MIRRGNTATPLQSASDSCQRPLARHKYMPRVAEGVRASEKSGTDAHQQKDYMLAAIRCAC